MSTDSKNGGYINVVDVLAECWRLGVSMRVTLQGEVTISSQVPETLADGIRAHRAGICKLVLTADRMLAEATAPLEPPEPEPPTEAA